MFRHFIKQLPNWLRDDFLNKLNAKKSQQKWQWLLCSPIRLWERLVQLRSLDQKLKMSNTVKHSTFKDFHDTILTSLTWCRGKIFLFHIVVWMLLLLFYYYWKKVTLLVYQYCLKMWYVQSLERAGVTQKLTILERKNGLVLANTRVPVSGTWSILFPYYYFYLFVVGLLCIV